MENDDYSHFCLLLNEIVFRYECRMHGFCLMTNHVHLIVQVGEIALSKIGSEIGSGLRYEIGSATVLKVKGSERKILSMAFCF